MTLLLFPVILQAQLCNGSLGDPAVNITFGNGSGGNTGYTPTNGYSFTSSTCPDDGYYTITRNTSGCFGNSWHSVSSDHTGGGAFMLVNASYTPGDFFVDTVRALCPNTTYEFAAWIMNVLNRSGIRPNITFRIEAPDGTILQQYESGDIPETPSAIWKQYGFYFTTPVNNPVIILRMTNNAPGGLGNDLALDDITFRPCGEKISAGIVNYPDTVHVCEGNTDIFNFSGQASAAYQNPVYHWQLSQDTGRTWQDISGAMSLSYTRLPEMQPGVYWYRLTVVDASVQGTVSCRIASNVLSIIVHPDPLLDAGPDRVYLEGYPVQIQATATGEQISYGWSPASFMDDPTRLDPVVTPGADIWYTLYAVSAFGCRNEDSVFVRYVAGIFVPTAFTPNGDGKNDYWRIPYLDPGLGADVRVFNRWGGMVYHTRGGTVSWDGKVNGTPQAAGTYIYLVTFSDPRFKALKGTLTLIR